MEKFHSDLKHLKRQVIEMADFALKMLEDSVVSLKTQDFDLAADIYDRRKIISDYDRDIENKALKLIALYQPMATDLRTIACILKAITYLLRIGRFGKDISNITREIGDKPHYKKLVSIPHMGEIVAKMVRFVMDKFEKAEFDLEDAKYLTEQDDEVDEMRFSIFRECLSYMMEDPKYITQSAHYLMVARYLERCGDHACKIAEKVYYMANGEHIEIK